jgi:ribosomal protein S12 methylthiotransferase accessory factor
MARAWTPSCRPRLRRGIALAPADAGRWQARWDFDEITFLEGDACRSVLPWLAVVLDGRSIAELEAIARERSSLDALHEVLDCLDQLCFLTVGDGPHHAASGGLEAAIEAMAADPAETIRRARAVRVVVAGRSPVADSIVRSLAAMEFQPIDRTHSVEALNAATEDPLGRSVALRTHVGDGPAVFPIVVEPDWSPDELDAINKVMHDRRVPWMLVGAWNRRVLVGPIFVPGETACYACYRRRLASHRRHLEAFEKWDRWQRSQTDPAPAAPVLPAIADLAAAWTAAEVFHHVTGARDPRTLGRVLVYYPDDARLSVEGVLRVPWCPVCGR